MSKEKVAYEKKIESLQITVNEKEVEIVKLNMMLGDEKKRNTAMSAYLKSNKRSTSPELEHHSFISPESIKTSRLEIRRTPSKQFESNESIKWTEKESEFISKIEKLVEALENEKKEHHKEVANLEKQMDALKTKASEADIKYRQLEIQQNSFNERYNTEKVL